MRSTSSMMPGTNTSRRRRRWRLPPPPCRRIYLSTSTGWSSSISTAVLQVVRADAPRWRRSALPGRPARSWGAPARDSRSRRRRATPSSMRGDGLALAAGGCSGPSRSFSKASRFSALFDGGAVGADDVHAAASSAAAARLMAVWPPREAMTPSRLLQLDDVHHVFDASAAQSTACRRWCNRWKRFPGCC